MKEITLTLHDDTYNGDITYTDGKLSMHILSRETFKQRLNDNQSAPYMLLGSIYETKRLIYIGQTNNVKRRLCEHDRLKDFWVCAIVFTYERPFTKTELEWMEAEMISSFISSNMFDVIVNNQVPLNIAINEHDKEFLTALSIRIFNLLGIYGIRFTKLSIDDNTRSKTATHIIERIAKAYTRNMSANKYLYNEDESEVTYDNKNGIHGSYVILNNDRVILTKGSVISCDMDDKKLKIYELYKENIKDHMLLADIILETEKEAKILIGL